MKNEIFDFKIKEIFATKIINPFKKGLPPSTENPIGVPPKLTPPTISASAVLAIPEEGQETVHVKDTPLREKTLVA